MMVNDWERFQIEHSAKVIKEDTFDKASIKYIGGLDISFNKKDPNHGCAYLTVVDYITGKIVYEDHELTTMNIPYVSGFLGFREIEHYRPILERVKKTEFYPDIILVDGLGILHHRSFGSASHIGYVFDIPTIGIGKTLLCMDGMYEKKIKREMKEKGIKELKLIGDSGKEYGYAVVYGKDAINPIFVSIGHKISIETSLEIMRKMCVYRIPEPVRNSDIRSKLYL